ncbi:MAG: hypothetical protein NZ524_10575 [Thiobacillaceae bacterium]|nr:hypothetical protein [Thiobacillaceae bacterium]
MTETLLLLETSGNQNYIFSTNKLKQHIGASELTYRAGTVWLRQALGVDAEDSPSQWRDRLRRSGGRIADGIEVVIATSGKAVLICENSERAHAIVRATTTSALTDAPGLQLTGAVVELGGRTAAQARQAMIEVHQRFNAHRQSLSAHLARFPVLPMAAACDTSGLPAVQVDARDGSLASAASRAKNEAAPDWFKRIRRLRDDHQAEIRFVFGIDEIGRRFAQDYVGVLHADGNGLGQIVLAFDRWLDHGEDYFATLRDFSLELDEATERAFIDACASAQSLCNALRDQQASDLPVLPLILGGDDLVAVVGGDIALPFVIAFLRAFERRTHEQPTLSKVAKKALGAPHLGISAGLAWVKPHYPFALAYQLAESLLQSAKEIKRRVTTDQGPYPCSSFDAHLLLDASGGDLDAIRARRRGPQGERLWGGPYVVTPHERFAALDEGVRQWVESHHVESLCRAIASIQAQDEDGRHRLPRSQLHALREALSEKGQAADQLYGLLCQRYQGATDLGCSSGSLFHVSDAGMRTLFLDALSWSALWPGMADCAATQVVEAST